MPDRLTLGFDTSAAHCAAALLRGDTLLTSRNEEMAKGQAERLMPMIEEMLAEAGVGFRDIDVIGVGVGPGNFTGIRVAVAAARGLALAMGVPAIGIGATEALAFGLPRPCRIAIPSRNDTLIWQDFAPGDEPMAGGRPQQAATGALPPGPAPAAPAVEIAEGVARVARLMSDRGDLPRPAPLYLRAADAAPGRDAPPTILP
ncbi:tRNA (adenosine(37)-N6)-threonylcarbamoyltransferase complex dimerization subunit type 1 TsaB [Paracoccus sp. 1_MG-2023]|uniref:tRNA (adenosine(37)-N6)-threonylcarbamoyltransferase complex dimerization subunit type 1 TsaB n=1 Tax=unclassified Paracoccus (in: a-proteobacteria) TaxID=2688777 RepID=UPI001C09D447|nr:MULTISPECIES: tRNA (adenosine(37)-N6)-threonylcarbamoyltransferase complex dimerization subunit type 1 TsaB [unclassified Paracoccus (in: a-proteobacteria)]MBU2957109.1 tRNA (adenosine(37)-N6)-threonylcarbamoyltransferase complex dimerization subunit type 1 TsaB [Paracoccus sp. C2R09]MDO6669557.1 tRNA (adenosine(37)-N6)-threonylcarbamoyltransferase complex dimerization subunit type 1 TsaB [Paracoccus sp. 1_MG-2023]